MRRRPAAASNLVDPRRRWMLASVAGIMSLAAAAFGVYTIGRSRPEAPNVLPVPSDLPPLGSSEIGGTKSPVIDSVALARFAEQHQLPEIPDLNQLSWEAAHDFHNALKGVAKKPKEAASYGQLGRAFQSHRYPAKALACYSLARSQDQTAYEWPYYIGRIHADAYEFEQAIEAYESSAALKPDYAPTFLALGNLYLQTGESQKAQQAYQRFVTLRPQSSHGFLGLAQIARDEQGDDSAIDLLRKAISLNPKDFRAHNLLGQAYQQLGKSQEARYHLAIVKHLNQRDQRSKQVVFDDPLYHKMLASNTTDAALTSRLQAALSTGQHGVAIRLAEELCRRHPNDAARMNGLALAYKQARRFADALNRAEMSINLDSDFLKARITKAQLLLILRRHGEALELLDWIVARDPESFDGHYNRGAAQVLANQYDAAVESFRQAVRLRDDSARAHMALAEALGQAGRRTEANQEYRRALELDPSNARARQRLLETEE